MSAATTAARGAFRLHKVLTEQRSHQRYPIELELEYRLLSKGRSQHRGSGKTRNISSGGVLFEALGSAPEGSSIELMLSWPFLLEGVCPLRLIMRGRIVRSDVRGIAIQSSYHEFRTAGSRSAKFRQASFAARAK
ncbi:MAG TPA: PilZ domain-containing protein [Bryobacteraceae bacterium]|nr:PilZ domain-containing protein [Bryobacteraceae bacterium]